MAYVTGTANHAGDLLLKLEAFLTTNLDLVAKNQAWLSLKDSTAAPYNSNYTPNATGTWQLQRYFVGKGINRTDTIVVPMALFVNQTSSLYSLCAFPARGYDKSKGVSQQFQGVISEDVNPRTSIPLWNHKIQYWFFANSRRFIVIAKVASRYLSLHCGFIMPNGTDTEYPYPLYVGGSTNSETINYQYNDNATNDGQTVGSFWNPATSRINDKISSGSLMMPSGQLYFASTPSHKSVYNSRGNELWLEPYTQNINIQKTVDGQYLLRPIEFIATLNSSASLGWLDGCYWVSGFENSPENIITVGTDRYICFPSMIENGVNNFCAIKME